MLLLPSVHGRGRRIVAPTPPIFQFRLAWSVWPPPERVVFTEVVVETLGQQGDLASVLSVDESLHVAARSVALPQFCQQSSRNQSVFTRPQSEADFPARSRHP